MWARAPRRRLVISSGAAGRSRLGQGCMLPGSNRRSLSTSSYRGTVVRGRACQFPEMEASQLRAGLEAHLRHSGGDGGHRGPSHPRHREETTGAVMVLPTAMEAAVQTLGLNGCGSGSGGHNPCGCRGLTLASPALGDRLPHMMSPYSCVGAQECTLIATLAAEEETCVWEAEVRNVCWRVCWSNARGCPRGPRETSGLVWVEGGARHAGSDGGTACPRADAVPGSEPEHQGPGPHAWAVRWGQTPGH